MSEVVENVIIIGSGPAGHTAAVYAARANLKPLMFEGFSAGGLPGGQLMTTTDVENYPGFADGVSGPELMLTLRKQSERFGTRIFTQDVEKVDFKERPFTVVSDGVVHKAKAVIVATGATAKWLGLPSERRLSNFGVSACATCDGALPHFRNQELVVVGGGDTAMEEAQFLTRFASKVVLVHRRSEFRASKIMVDRAQKNPKIELMTNTVVEEILGESHVTGIRLRRNNEVMERPVAGVFIAIGHQPNTSIFDGQLTTDETGYVVTQGKSSYTNIEGVFACGDVQDKTYRQA
ncbi:MAG: thioredoxin-disulfide reductase, partial [Clostridia bacterium]|nr:thioredoxin-disulfide reductase [Deltaproteobacteria bacterium]